MATSETEAIAAELTQAIEGIAEAQHQAMATAEHAGQVAAQAAGTGLVGVAQAMAGIRTQIAAIHGTLSEAAGHGTGAVNSLREVSDQMSPAEANGHLSTSVQRIDAMRHGLLTAAQQVHTVKGRVEATLRGGQPGPVLQRLDSMVRYIATTAQRGDPIKDKINATIAKTGQLGN